MKDKTTYQISETQPADRAWVQEFTRENWGDDFVVVRGIVYYPHQLPGLIAYDQTGARQGLLSYSLRQPICEIITLNSLSPNHGVGRTLVEAISRQASARSCTRLLVVTTNDNLAAARFYRRRGFLLTGYQVNAINQSRRLKPDIPRRSQTGLPIRDELIFEKFL